MEGVTNFSGAILQSMVWSRLPICVCWVVGCPEVLFSKMKNVAQVR